jgi:hypothetical protein
VLNDIYTSKNIRKVVYIHIETRLLVVKRQDKKSDII